MKSRRNGGIVLQSIGRLQSLVISLDTFWVVFWIIVIGEIMGDLFSGRKIRTHSHHRCSS